MLSQEERYKNLGVLLTSRGRMVQEIDRGIDTAPAAMLTLHGFAVVKRDLSQKARFSVVALGCSMFIGSSRSFIRSKELGSCSSTSRGSSLGDSGI